MFTKISILFVLLFSTLNLFAQTPNLTAPTNWENYRFGEKEVSVLLPKMPVRLSLGDFCNGEETFQFGAYSDKVVYVFRITTKAKAPVYFCRTKKEFDKQNFEKRIIGLESEISKLNLTKTIKTGEIGKEEIRFSGDSRTYRVINDFVNNRWFEFWVIGANDSKLEVKNFLASLKIGKDTSGKEIGEGSPFTIGDETLSTETTPKSDKNNTATDKKELISIALMPIIKPRTGYTEAARYAQIQGTVRLRVTFNLNGSVSNIEILSRLDKGLTEKAIEAARKIVFLPATGNGTNITVTKEVAYTFNLI